MNNSNSKKRPIFPLEKYFVVPKNKSLKSHVAAPKATVKSFTSYPSKPPTSSSKSSRSKSQHVGLDYNMIYESHIPLSEEQRLIVDTIFKERKNVLLTGSAGTGKSFLLMHIIKVFHRIQENECEKGIQSGFGLVPESLVVTASTGLAACNIKGTTIHSFAGIGTGAQALAQLVKKVKYNKKALNRWIDTKVLIIDEISMVSADLFEKLDGLARILRNKNTPFGGIQIILAGDFFQLPPIDKSGTNALNFCFEASKWKQCVERVFSLTCIYRQKDKDLAYHLNELRVGNVPENTVKFFESLSRPISYGSGMIEPTELYSTRYEVDRANKQKLSKLNGTETVYESIDWCKTGLDKSRLDSLMMTPKTLSLKINSQVMLIKNMTTIHKNLVNGAIGIVVAFCQLNEKETEKKNSTLGFYKNAYPKVRFLDGHEQIISPEISDIEQNGDVIATRLQFPLVLAWAISIHKAQGQSLPLMKVDLRKVFEKGQTYVALSRATSSEGLQVLNFDKNKIRCHQKVIEFYKQIKKN